MDQKLSLYLPPSFAGFIPRHSAFSTWTHHTAFGYDLVAAVRPELLVELGTYNGQSFFSFCQSMEEHKINGLCYAVDIWTGDSHTGEYDNDVYQKVLNHSREFYASFSYLMRMRFNDAVQHFRDETIDLLHIDGLHTYAAVCEDFENWYPKVRPGGIILFHDICARMKDYAVWKFWDEISPQHETFSFRHGFGLGVLRKPGGIKRDEPLLDWMFSKDQSQHAKVRTYYEQTAQHVALKRRYLRRGGGEPLLPVVPGQRELANPFQAVQEAGVRQQAG